jgi:predicted acylesterase/phospholipase RssA
VTRKAERFLGPTLSDEPIGSRPFAYVLSGGAALGSWQGGVLHALHEGRSLRAHSVVGTSAGAINGAAYLQGDFDLLRMLWRSIPRSKFMKWSPGVSPPRLWSLDSVRGYLETVISEKACREGGRCWFYPVSADLANGETLQAEFSPDPDGPWEGPLADKLAGSMAVPFLFPPARASHETPGKRDRVLVDGHVTSSLFLDRLARRGVRDFVFVNVISDAEMRAPGFRPRAFIGTLIHQLLEAQIENGLEPLRYGFPELGVRAFVLRPSTPLRVSVFKFDKEECRRAFDQGMRDAGAWFDKPGPTQIL